MPSGYRHTLLRWTLHALFAGGLLSAGCAHADFVTHADGTVTDTATGLVWDRCAIGQRTTVTPCDSGTAATLTWADALVEVLTRNTAQHLGYSDWRMPNRSELATLTKLDAFNPAIDAVTFPNATGYHWTSTSSERITTQAMTVDFYSGLVGDYPKPVPMPRLRLVRSGPAMATYDALLPVVEGTCGSAHGSTLYTAAPATGLCSFGNETSVTTSPSTYGWQCKGSNTGQDASCSALRGYQIQMAAGTGGGAVCTPNPVGHGGTAHCTATAAPAYTFSGWQGDCTGTSDCTLSGVTSTRNVAAQFSLQTHFSATTPTGSGTAWADITGGGGACGFATAGYQTASTIAPPPPGMTFLHGVLAFTTNTCVAGSIVTVTLTYPQPLPPNARFFKYGPPAAGQPSQWYEHPASITGSTVTYSVTDGGAGDSDGASGVITDPAGVAVPAATTTSVPTLGGWAAALLAGGLGLLGGHVRRRRLTMAS